MPVSTGQYKNNETLLFHELQSQLGFNTAIACGILANADKESKFRTQAIGDSGTSVGLFQWHKGRKTALINYCNSAGVDPYSVRGQVMYLKHELNNSESKAYNKIKDLPNTSQGAYDAGYNFCVYFERPAGGKTSGRERGNLAKNSYWPYYSSGQSSSDSYVGYDTPVDSSPSTSPEIDFNSLTSNDIYKESVAANLSAMEAVGYDYGYLIDVTHGGFFKFYVPDYTEQAGANWGDIKIPGRSVDIKNYESTSSRSVSISLELYAGVGVYSSSSGDIVGRMYQDINFVKSLEYPDYTTAVAQPPSTVHLILGSTLDILGVVSGVSVEHRAPIDTQNRSMYVKLSFTVTEIAANPPDYRDIRNRQYAITSTSNTSSLQIGSISSNINDAVGLG